MVAEIVDRSSSSILGKMTCGSKYISNRPNGIKRKPATPVAATTLQMKGPGPITNASTKLGISFQSFPVLLDKECHGRHGLSLGSFRAAWNAHLLLQCGSSSPHRRRHNHRAKIIQHGNPSLDHVLVIFHVLDFLICLPGSSQLRIVHVQILQFR